MGHEQLIETLKNRCAWDEDDRFGVGRADPAGRLSCKLGQVAKPADCTACRLGATRWQCRVGPPLGLNR